MTLKKIEKITLILSAVVMGIVSIVILYTFLGSKNQSTVFYAGNVHEVAEMYSLGDEGEITLPYSVKGKAGETIEINGIIPEDIDDHCGMMFRSLYCKCEAYAGDRLLSTYGDALPLKYGRMVGNIRVIVPLSSEMAGQEYTIYLTPYYDQNMDLPEIVFGSTDSLIVTVIQDNIVRAIICIILITVLLLTIGLILYQFATKNEGQIEVLIHFVFFIIMVVLWIICSSDIPQFITDCNEGVSLISFICLATMCIPYLGYCKEILRNGRKIICIIRMIGWFLPALNVLLFVLNICDPMNLLLCTHIYILAAMGTSFFYAIREWKNGISNRILVVGMVFLVIAALAGLVCYYAAPSKGYDATCFGIGFVLFVGTLFAVVINRQIEVIQEQKFMETYRELAYSDVLTGLENRTAFEQKFNSLQETEGVNCFVTLFVMNVNGLKRINDIKGHQAGDQIIMAVGECIRRVFDEDGHCYRLGGDEFAAVLVDKPDDGSVYKLRLLKTIDNYNSLHDEKISCSIGYAGKIWSDDESYLRKLFHDADVNMQEDKRKFRKLTGDY